MHSTALSKRQFPCIRGGHQNAFLRLLLLALFLPFASTSQGVSFTVKNAALEQVFRLIEKQTPYRFVFTREELHGTRPVSFSVQEAPITQVLNLCFDRQPVTYSLTDRMILVKARIVEPSIPAKPVTAPPVSGTVYNEAGELLAGATVMIKGTGAAVATDGQGRFEMSEVPRGATLIISSVGYASREVVFQGAGPLTITLTRQVSTLDETIVIAYGTTTRRLNTGSVSKVSGADINKQPVSNPLAALQGRVPGLMITQGNGLPGSNFTVRLRGQNSIQSGNSPLFIIDGIPFLTDAERLTQRSSLNANSPFNTLNPGDIESIEVLKDADATAIYGSRGANGVVLITTRKAKAGKTTVDAGLYTGWGKVTRTMEYMNTQEYLQMRREAFANDGVVPTVSNAPDLLVWDTTRYTDWKKAFIGGTARNRKAFVKLSGGSGGTRFSFGADHYRETTVFPGDFADAVTTASLQVNHRSPGGKLNAAVSATYGYDQSNLMTQDLTNYINLAPNMYPLYDVEGKLVWSEGGVSSGNPLAVLLNQYNGLTSRLTSSSVVSYEVLPQLLLKTNFGYNEVGFSEEILSPKTAQNPAHNPSGSAFFGNRSVRSWIVEPQAEYSASLGKKGKVQVLAGGSWQKNTSKSASLSGSGYSNDYQLSSIAGAATVQASNTKTEYRYQSFFSRVNYNWDGIYLLNLTGRIDASSRFSPDQQQAPFGALGLGWNFIRLEKIQRAMPFLSFGKLRGSWGVTGNDQIGDYQYFDSYSTTRYPYAGQPALRPSRLFNPDYNWERNKKLEAALELGFFHDRILTTVNWYRNRSDNQIIRYSLPSQTGFTDILRNFPGQVENKGWEVSLTTENIQGRALRWSTSFNISWNRNQLLSFPGLETSTYATTYIIGQPLNILTGFLYEGVDPKTGIYSFKDMDGDGVITYPDGTSFRDYVVAGTTTPDFFGGLQNSLAFKGWSLDLLLQFVKQKGQHPIYTALNPPGSYWSNQPVAVLNRWQKPGDRASYGMYTQNFSNPALYPASYYLATSTAALTDASFIRLKNVSLSWELPRQWTRKAAIEKGRVYLQAQNLLTLTRYRGADPESQNRSALPPLRMVTAGFALSF